MIELHARLVEVLNRYDRLTVLDAGEMSSPACRANPNDRCYFCKSRLHYSIRVEIGG